MPSGAMANNSPASRGVLDLYADAPDICRSLICFDETSRPADQRRAAADPA